MNNIIFLDIDGVLNTTGDINLIENTFEESKLLNLVKLVNNTDSNLVIISDRRLIVEERMMIDNVFDEFKISVNYLSFNRTHKKRSDEIIDYLNNHNYSYFVILDDNDLGYSNDSLLKDHYINTYDNGFTLIEYNKALKILNINTNYQLIINDKLIGIYSFINAKEKVLNIIKNHILEEDQAYQYNMPFNLGSNINYMIEERFASDYELIIFERIRMMLNDLILNNINIRPIDYIKKDYECHRSFDFVNYDLYIKKNHNEIILEINTDEDHLYTNMFHMIEGNNYYFNSKQEIIIKDKFSKRELGEIVKIDILLKPIEDDMETMRKLMNNYSKAMKVLGDNND